MPALFVVFASLINVAFVLNANAFVVINQRVHSYGKRLPSIPIMSNENPTGLATVAASATNATPNGQEMESCDETIGQMLGGLVFVKTNKREELVKFYTSSVGMSVWLEQPNITILSHGNMVLGFHQIIQDQSNGMIDEPDLQGMYTFVYPTREGVDEMYSKLKGIADGPPRDNKRYRIYQFFAKDPEGRNLEFQAFLHPLKTVTSEVM